MTDKERFLRCMSYESVDRVPLLDLGFWAETLDAWRKEGLPDDVKVPHTDSFFGMDGFMRFYVSPEATDAHCLVDRGMVVQEGIRVGLVPLFEERVIEDLGGQEIFQCGDGALLRRHKRMSSIPFHMGHLLKDKRSWEQHYAPKLDPTTGERYPKNWAPLLKTAKDTDREHILLLPGGSLYGWLRNWMGLENVSLALHDDPVWFEKMVDTVFHCILGVLKKTLDRGGTYDACLFWEDMCYNHGPLISPTHFRRLLSPRYEAICRFLEGHGVRTIIVDTDGRVNEIVPLFLNAGVNCLLPIEIGTTGMDPVSLRREFGRDLRIIGGVDKRILSRGPSAIDEEVRRLRPLMEEGGFIPTCDHKVPPDVPYVHYCHFLRCLGAWPS